MAVKKRLDASHLVASLASARSSEHSGNGSSNGENSEALTMGGSGPWERLLTVCDNIRSRVSELFNGMAQPLPQLLCDIQTHIMKPIFTELQLRWGFVNCQSSCLYKHVLSGASAWWVRQKTKFSLNMHRLGQTIQYLLWFYTKKWSI